jgi:hypothetical protein
MGSSERYTIAKTVPLVILLAGLAASKGRIEARGQAREFVSDRYGFSMAVPPGWGASVELDTPVFFYAPDSEKFVQAEIPKGGAVLTTECQDTISGLARSATTPEAWARVDMRISASGVSPIESFQFPPNSGVSHAVISSYNELTFSPDQRVQRSVAIFWQFGKQLFAAHLNYNADDRNGPALQRAFLRTIRSLRPLDRR